MCEQFVWVVMRGQANEGGDIVDILSSRDKANEAFDATVREVERDTGEEAKIESIPNDGLSATFGSNWVDMTRYPVN